MPQLARHIAERSDLTAEEAIDALRAAQVDDLNNKQRARRALNLSEGEITMELQSYIKRGPGRPPNPKKSPVQVALERAAPAQLTDAVDKVKKAIEAFRRASSARSEFLTPVSMTGIPDLQRELQQAVVRREVADRIGDDGDAPSLEEIADLQHKLDAALAERDGRQQKLEAFGREVERRRELLDDAWAELSAQLSAWREPVRKEAEAALEQAARAVSEAYAADQQTDPTGYAARQKPTLPRVVGGGSHTVVGDVSIPREIQDALDVSRQAYRILVRP